MKNEAIIKSIQCLLSGYKELQGKEGDNKKEMDSLRYLLNQSIRQYDIPKENYHISVGAKQRWEELCSDNIANYSYHKKVRCDKLQSAASYLFYKGSSKEGTECPLEPRESFTFRGMFHEEHIIPVSFILQKLIEVSDVSEQTVKGILDGMHICVILKEEDRKMNSKSGRTAGRTGSFAENEKNVYNECGITLLPYDQFPY